MDKLICGAIEIQFPDENYSVFFVSQDMADLFKVETNDEALRLIRKVLREKLDRKFYNRIEFDQESNAVTIAIAKGELMFEVARILNSMLGIYLSSYEEEQIKGLLLNYKRLNKDGRKEIFLSFHFVINKWP
ncbi:hypothetical protein ACT6P6_20715 [Priestia endophytica]|uniref:hypothetical protein n=1 Tax=Priestia filamentosa TaxID=1402861 RepID=UPI003D2A1E92